MKAEIRPAGVIERLQRLQASASLSAQAGKTAETLVKRLSSPVRVTLLGPPGVGKSRLRDILAGEAVVPPDMKLPTTELRFAERRQIVATLADRSVRTVEGLDFAALRDLPLAYVEIQAPLPGLRDLRLLDVVTDNTRRDMTAATRWAATRTDIAIWITSDFGADEQAVWSGLPEALKDHAYLVLNQVRLLSSAERDSRKTRLRAIVAQEFRAFFVTATVTAQIAGGPNGKDESLNEIGCEALRGALGRHVDMASQADLDGALMFLSRFEPSEAAPMAPATPPAAQDTAKEPASLSIDKIISRDAENDAPASRDIHRTALERISAGAGGLLSELGSPSAPLADLVLDHCMETVEDLAARLPDADDLYDPVQEANDLIVLLHLERNETAAENAVTALLQLKRDLEVALAA